MTALATPAPRTFNHKKFFIAIILAFIVASIAGLGIKAFATRPDVTVKPCLTCPSCSCKPILGGLRCGCPR